jgi:hypothetical protein
MRIVETTFVFIDTCVRARPAKTQQKNDNHVHMVTTTGVASQLLLLA